MRKILANGVNLHYQQHGAGSDVILLHGLTGDLSYWLFTVLPRLVERHRVTIYDLRGHGFSDAPPTGYTSRDMAADLRGLMDGLEIERAHLVGHSFGGAVALHFAALCPERVHSLALADASIPALRHHAPLRDWPMYAEYQTLLRPMGVELPEDPENWDLAEVVREMYKLPALFGVRRGLPRQDRRSQRLRTRTTCLQDVETVDGLGEEQIRAVAAPTLALYTEDGPFLGIGRYLAEHLPRCRAVIQSDGDHFFPAAAPADLAELLLEHFACPEGGEEHPAAGAANGAGQARISTTERARQVIEGLNTSVSAFATLLGGLEAGLLEALTEPRTVPELSGRTRLPVALVARMLDVLGALGLVRQEGDCFSAEPGLLPLLQSPAREDLLANLRSTHLQSREIIEQARRGTLAPGWRSTDPDFLQAHGRAGRAFVEATALRALPMLVGLEARLQAPGAAFLDVGAGVGTAAIELCRLFPNLQAVGLEPHEPALAEARRNVEAAGLAGRIALRAGRVEELTDDGAYDLAQLPPMFMPAAVVARGLRAVRQALRPGGWIWIPVMSAPGAELSPAVWRFLDVLWGGEALVAEQIAAMVREAGYEAVLNGGIPGSPFKGVVGRRPL